MACLAHAWVATHTVHSDVPMAILKRRLQRSHKVGTGLQKAETTALAGQGAAPSGQQQQHQHQQDLQHHPQPEVRRSRRSRDAHAQKREAALQRLSPEVRVVLEAVEEGDESGGPGEGGPWLWWLESKSRQIAWSLLLFGCRCASTHVNAR
eukprot:scaffold181035_cov22-Tisochrysis_lutea.AAC.1